MKLGIRQLTRLEHAGILAVVIVVGIFCYLKIINADAGRKLKRVKREYAQISSEVNRLRAEAKTGRPQRVVNDLRKRIARKERELEKAEAVLARDNEVNKIANEILRTAARTGMMIKEFGRMTDENKIETVSKGEELYSSKYYKMTLEGRFASLRALVEKISHLPKLVAIRRIIIEKPEEEESMRAELWISI